MVHLMMHHYHLDYEQIGEMTLRQVVDALDDILLVNPMCSSGGEKPSGPPTGKGRYGSVAAPP